MAGTQDANTRLQGTSPKLCPTPIPSEPPLHRFHVLQKMLPVKSILLLKTTKTLMTEKV